MNRETAVIELKETFRILNDDLNEIQNLYIEKPSGALHRALIRAYSAFIEGTLYQLRQVAIHSAGSANAVFSAEELMLLKELQVSLNKRGEIETKDNYERFLPMLLFTFKQYVRVHGANFEPDTSVAGWVAMREFVKVRNLLMHPKSSNELEIEKDSSSEINKAVYWFHDTCLSMFSECSRADEHYSHKDA
ncbi:hypothetical protein [Spongiibacter sp. UBA1325]|uniref:hypothetical protein n=1 Tax=Spongiibacter sp. UBA1325 TaxID=1947543 RepID=UPI00257AC7C5|nr:hypothetical protein [Spongiibacter sp. UBA1325]|tara:strand:- start:4559 stop:5131 length:573 start_codon:yes stop_codon:yes gene_type:complete